MPDATNIIMHQKSEKSVNYGCNKGFLYVAPERYTSDSATPQRDVHGRIAPVVAESEVYLSGAIYKNPLLQPQLTDFLGF